jgi:UDP-GlcNAc:undecaprenyl-phosphate GlcNAc-1-phosphate transferase
MLVSTAIAFALALAGYGLALRFFPRLGLLDFPERYGLKRARLPYPTGLVAVVTFLLVFLIGNALDTKEVGVVIAVCLLGITTFLDDRSPLPPVVRLLIQVVAAALLFATGSRIYTLTNPLGGILKLDGTVIETGIFGTLPVMSGLFTIGWLLLTINALNWFDGIPGQVSVISTIGFLMLGCLAYFRNDQSDIATLSFILAAISLAGALFDVRGKMLIGDSGSMFFGLMLGLLGVYQGGKVATVFLALGIPLLDAAFVILRRLMRGHSPLRGGRDHLHHLLLDRGWKSWHVIALTAGVGTLFGGIALFLNTQQKGVAFVALVVIVLLLTSFAKRKK